MVYRHGFRNALTVSVRWINLPAPIKFDERQGIGRVSIHFVCGHVNEYRLGAVEACRLKQHGSSVCVHGQIRKWIGCRPIVRGLCRRVDNEVDFVACPAKDPEDLVSVAYVDFAMNVVAVLTFEPLANPSR